MSSVACSCFGLGMLAMRSARVFSYSALLLASSTLRAANRLSLSEPQALHILTDIDTPVYLPSASYSLMVWRVEISTSHPVHRSMIG